MADLGALRRQRAELDQQIAAAEQEEFLTWNLWLEDIEAALVELYREIVPSGVALATEERKSVRTLTFALRSSAVSVGLGRAEQDYRGSLDITAADMRWSFSAARSIPSPAVVVLLVRELLKYCEQQP